MLDMENAVLMTMERAMKKIFKEIAALQEVPTYEELKARYLPSDPSEIEEEPKQKKKAAPKKKEAKPKESESDGEVPEKGKCQGVTVKGLPCKKNAMSGGCFCSVHKPKEGDEEPKKKKEKKAVEKKGEPLEEEAFGTPPPSKKKAKSPSAPKKSLPVHTHEVDEEIHEDCDMCQTHGNSATGTNPKYEVAQDLKSRLASILGAIDGSDEEIEEEAEALIAKNEETLPEELVEDEVVDDATEQEDDELVEEEWE
jgi:23S rRNA pseudoU1915 N3-methylase RlmH